MRDMTEFKDACNWMLANVIEPYAPVTPEKIVILLDGLTKLAIQFGFKHRPQIIMPHAFMVDPDGERSFKVEL